MTDTDSGHGIVSAVGAYVGRDVRKPDRVVSIIQPSASDQPNQWSKAFMSFCGELSVERHQYYIGVAFGFLKHLLK